MDLVSRVLIHKAEGRDCHYGAMCHDYTLLGYYRGGSAAEKAVTRWRQTPGSEGRQGRVESEQMVCVNDTLYHYACAYAKRIPLISPADVESTKGIAAVPYGDSVLVIETTPIKTGARF